MASSVSKGGIGRLISPRQLRLLLALPLAALLVAAAYRIGRLALAENFARSDPEQALRWSAGHPAALRARAEHLRGLTPHDRVEVESLLRRSLATDPVDGRSYGLLGMEAANHGRESDADRLLEVGVRRAPRDFGLRVFAVLRSLRSNHLEDATRHLVALVRVNPNRPDQTVQWLWYIYTGSKEGRDAVARVALEPSAWRQELLRHIAAHEVNPAEVLRLIGDLDRREIPANAVERDQVVEALFSRQAWVHAFALWAQDPALAGVRAIANVFNGDFERELSGRRGFDWELINPVDALVAVEPDSSDGRSLRIELLGIDSADALIRHRLLVGPGRYRLRARVRSEGLRADIGPVLVLTCLDPRVTSPLATLDLASAGGPVSDWKVRTAALEIPNEGCAAQLLELRPRRVDSVAEPAHGSFWIDDVTLVRDG